MRKNFIFIAGIVSVSLCLAGCFVSKMPEVTARIETGHFLNPNLYHQASPVVIIFYQLKSSFLFQQLGFLSLYDNAEKTLGADLLDKYEIELRPGETQVIHFNLSPAANYIGVIAAYREPDRTQWRQIISITPRKSLRLQAIVGAQNIMIMQN